MTPFGHTPKQSVFVKSCYLCFFHGEPRFDVCHSGTQKTFLRGFIWRARILNTFIYSKNNQIC